MCIEHGVVPRQFLRDVTQYEIVEKDRARWDVSMGRSVTRLKSLRFTLLKGYCLRCTTKWNWK